MNWTSPSFTTISTATAIIAVAGLINACEITKRKMSDIKVVVNGAGAAGLSVTSLIKMMGVKNIIVCDRDGVVYRGRESGMDQFKSVPCRGHAAAHIVRSA